MAALHTDVTEVGGVAERARVRELILSHYLPAEPDAITAAEWAERAGQGFSGKTTAGSDGLRIALPTRYLVIRCPPAITPYRAGRVWCRFGEMEGTTFFSVLGQLAEADPGRPALTCGDVTLTRAQFVARVKRLAALFAARGVVEGSTVTIGLPNSTGLVESLFAAWALGAVPQPISDRLPPLERSAIVDLADPSLVVGVPPSEAGAWPTMESLPRAASRGLVYARACRRCGSS